MYEYICKIIVFVGTIFLFWIYSRYYYTIYTIHTCIYIKNLSIEEGYGVHVRMMQGTDVVFLLLHLWTKFGMLYCQFMGIYT